MRAIKVISDTWKATAICPTLEQVSSVDTNKKTGLTEIILEPKTVTEVGFIMHGLTLKGANLNFPISVDKTVEEVMSILSKYNDVPSTEDDTLDI